MTNSRLQHVIPGALILAIALLVTYLSFTEEPVEAFLFPRIISVAFVGLAIWNFIRAAGGMAKVGRGVSLNDTKNLIPGLIVMLILVFWAAKALGFYVSATIAFFAVYSIYDPAPHSSTKDWIKRAVITAAFMAVIYALFALLLKVQTPRGMFI